MKIADSKIATSVVGIPHLSVAEVMTLREHKFWFGLYPQIPTPSLLHGVTRVTVPSQSLSPTQA